MHRTIVVTLVSALALGIASCGGTEPRLTGAQLVAKVEAACVHARVVATRQARTSHAPPSMQLLAAAIAGQGALDERLRRLNPPDAEKQGFGEFRNDIEQRLATARRALAAGRSVAPTAANQALYARVDALAKRMGFMECV